MAIQREFLSWHEPLLPQAAAWLLQQPHAKTQFAGPVDLTDYLVVVPVASARRRLLELLVEQAGGRLLTPEIMTPAELPERLYAVQKPFASPYTQQMAWRAALKSMDPSELAHVVPVPPEPNAFREWLSLADLLARQHRELAADALDFQKVAELGPTLPRFPEQDRWNTLAEIEKRYLHTLDGLQLWDRQEARLFAIRENECESSRPIVLVGASDLNQIVRDMLDQVAERQAGTDADVCVTTLVHAEASEAAAFDRHGCLNVASWEERPVPIDRKNLVVAEGPDDQAAAIGLALAELGDRYRSADVAIACPDDRLVPIVQRRLSEAGLPTRWTVGRSLDRSRPGRLLAALADHVDRANSDTTLALLQHPDVLQLVDEEQRGHVIEQLAKFRLSRYPRRLRVDQFEAVPDPQDLAAAAAGVRIVDDLAAPLAGASKRTVGGWMEAAATVISRVYGDREFDAESLSDTETLQAIESLSALRQQFDRCPDELDVRIVSGDALRLILSRLSDQSSRPGHQVDAVTLTGWLEMPLDDRPVSIVTSFNDGVIPTAVTSDLFLPGTLRRHLRLNDNARRYARDAYATTVLVHSSENVRFVVARRDADGNPQSPSRLLFTSTPTETVHVFQELLKTRSDEVELASTWRPVHQAWNRPVPPIDSNNPRMHERLRPPITLSVTAFRSYIACPYRFYLRYVLGLHTAEEVDEELSAAAFGKLVHTVLGRFGRDDVRHTQNAKVIRDFVVAELKSYAGSQFGSRPLAAIQVQLETARQRLEKFASVQAEHREAGWHISYSETDDEDRSGTWTQPFDDHEGQPANLRGRIDRIDRHDDGRWLILDYKTGDTAKLPRAAHLKPKAGEWIDLQLPLYRHLGEAIDVSGDVTTGYFNLPKSLDDCAIEQSDFTDEELASADDLARRILMSVRKGEFGTRADKVDFDDYAAICQSDVLEVASDGGAE